MSLILLIYFFFQIFKIFFSQPTEQIEKACQTNTYKVDPVYWILERNLCEVRSNALVTRKNGHSQTEKMNPMSL